MIKQLQLAIGYFSGPGDHPHLAEGWDADSPSTKKGLGADRSGRNHVGRQQVLHLFDHGVDQALRQREWAGIRMISSAVAIVPTYF